MNNKGFAITTIIFGTMILFCLLLVSLLGILSAYKNNVEKLVDNERGARGIVTLTLDNNNGSCYTSLTEIKNKGRGLYCVGGSNRYVSNGELKGVS